MTQETRKSSLLCSKLVILKCRATVNPSDSSAPLCREVFTGALRCESGSVSRKGNQPSPAWQGPAIDAKTVWRKGKKKTTWKRQKINKIIIMERYGSTGKGAVPHIYFYPGVWHVYLLLYKIAPVSLPLPRQICGLYLCHLRTALDLWTSTRQRGTKPRVSIWNVAAFPEWVVLVVGTSSPCQF